MGLYYLAFLLIWFGVLWWVVKGLTWRVNHRYKRLISLIVTVVVYPLPLADEIVGAIQFSKLCEHQVTYKDPNMEKKIGSRLVYMHHEREKIDGRALPITSEIVEFVYESDQSLMFKYIVFRAGQGFFARNFRLNEGGSPLAFSGVCYPKEMQTLFTEYKVVN